MGYSMFYFTEEGEFVSDNSQAPLIPGGMCQGSYTVRNEKIWVTGMTVAEDEVKFSMRVFDGAKWSLVS